MESYSSVNSDIPLVHIVHPVSREHTVMANSSELELPADPKWEISRTRLVLVRDTMYLVEFCGWGLDGYQAEACWRWDEILLR